MPFQPSFGYLFLFKVLRKNIHLLSPPVVRITLVTLLIHLEYIEISFTSFNWLLRNSANLMTEEIEIKMSAVRFLTFPNFLGS